MERTNRYFIRPRDLDFVSGFRAIMSFCEKRGMTLEKTSQLDFRITFNQYESASCKSFDEFAELLKHTQKFHEMVTFFQFSKSGKSPSIGISIFAYPDRITVSINGTNDDLMIAAHSFIKSEWDLSNPPILPPEEGRPKNLQATIFLGKHFDAASEKPSQSLRQFLELLRFDVREAEEYRALPIPEKVQRLIARQDIYLGLVTGKREHDWLIAEASFAKGKERHVIMVVEQDSGFNPTIHGRDYEQVRFPSNSIEKSFIPLMQEFRSLGISGL